MNLQQFRAILDLGSDAEGRTMLPAAEPAGQRIFGGQILAQLIAAAESGRTVKSLQVAFPRSGRPRHRAIFNGSLPKILLESYGYGVYPSEIAPLSSLPF